MFPHSAARRTFFVSSVTRSLWNRQKFVTWRLSPMLTMGKQPWSISLFRQSGMFRDNQQVTERLMDSMDLERERGITITVEERFLQVQGLLDQHYRYPRPCRLRRPGRAGAAHGRRRAAAGRRPGRADAADLFRAEKGPGRTICRSSSSSTRSTNRRPAATGWSTRSSISSSSSTPRTLFSISRWSMPRPRTAIRCS